MREAERAVTAGLKSPDSRTVHFPLAENCSAGLILRYKGKLVLKIRQKLEIIQWYDLVGECEVTTNQEQARYGY